MGFAFGDVGEAQDAAFVAGDEPAQDCWCGQPLFAAGPDLEPASAMG